MKKLNNIIPEFDKLAPIFFLMLLNLVAYANYNNYSFDGTVTITSAFVFISSLVYAYVISTPKFSIKEMLMLLLFLIVIAIQIKEDTIFNSVSVIFILAFFNNKQHIIITVLKLLIGVGIQFILGYVVFNYLTESALIFTIIYFPFSILLYKGGKLCLDTENGSSQKE